MSYDFMKWKLETELEQRHKRSELKIKHSSRHKLIREGNRHKRQECWKIGPQTHKRNPETATNNPLNEPNNNTPSFLALEFGGNHKISRHRRRLLKDPLIQEDIVRYKLDPDLPFQLSDNGVWKSTTNIGDKDKESACVSTWDLNNATGYRGSNNSTNAVAVESGYEDNHLNLGCKDRLYIWWLKNFVSRMGKQNISNGERSQIPIDKKQVGQRALEVEQGTLTSIMQRPKVRNMRNSTGNSLKSFQWILVCIIVSFFVVLSFKTVFMFLAPDDEVLTPLPKEICLSIQNACVVLLCVTHFFSFNPDVQDQINIRHSLLILPFALMTVGSYLNYGFFMYRQDCMHSKDVGSGSQCVWTRGFGKWFDVIMMMGSLLSIISYHSHFKEASNSNSV